MLGDHEATTVAGQQQTADLVIQALNMALITRKPQDVIHHSDQGSQYTSVDFGKRCKEMGVRPSMGRRGFKAEPCR